MKRALFFFVTGLCLTLHCKSTAQRGPNIIFIMADDLGYGDIEPYGQRKIKTPNLVRMAAEGMKFTRHYAGTSVCAPSRCVLMTGLHNGHAEIRGNLQAEPYGQVPLSDEAVTVAELLKAAGYRTALIGKWGLGEPGTAGDPLKQGFDYYFGYTDQVLAHNHYPEFLLRNGEKVFLRNEVRYLEPNMWHKGRASVTSDKKDFADQLFLDEAIRYVRQNQDAPFFLYLPFIIPHDNGEAPRDQQFESPPHPRYEKEKWSAQQKAYASSITYLDEYVGKILDELVKLKMDENTLVVFTSDNGPRDDNSGFDSNGGLRGIKRDLYEGGIRVPFIAWWPRTIRPNSTSQHVSAFWDFLPTATALAGVKQPNNVDGISMAPVLTGRGRQEAHDFLYFEFHEKKGSVAVIKGEWKAVLHDVKSEAVPPLELFNLSKDPAEEKDVAAQYPDKVSEMRKLIAEARSPSALFPLAMDK